MNNIKIMFSRLISDAICPIQEYENEIAREDTALAISDAIIVLYVNNLYECKKTPYGLVSGDGVVSINWRDHIKKIGVNLVFGGDGTVAIGTGSPTKGYATENETVNIDKKLPEMFWTTYNEIINE